MNVLYLLAIALPSLARNLCPGHEPPVLSRCNSDTLHSALPKGAFIETAREVNQGGCFGEDTFSNIFQCEECCLSSNHWDFGCNYAAYLPASCAVTVNMGTYRFGLIMPITTLWSGSLMAVGSSSYGGGINWKDMWTGPTYYGLATLSTDTGHRSVGSDMSWAKNNSQAQADWGYRSINGSTRAAKSLLEAYHLYPYNKVRYSYFSGCSTGGRQGIKQLEIDQSLFDGLLIGAPAWNQTHMLPWINKLATINPPGNSSSIYNHAYEETLIQRKIREACDGLDGVPDSIISRPDLCNITIVATHLRCRVGMRSDECLQPAQIETLIQVYQNYTISNDKGRQFLGFPAPELGSESDFKTWLKPDVTGAPNGFDWQWAINFLGYEPGYKFNDSMIWEAVNADPGHATARPELTDWAAFNRRGGKLILYQGLADGIIPAKSTTQYYEAIEAANSRAINNFTRYYQVPGMHHCFTSDWDPSNGNYWAPWMFGGIGQQSWATPKQTSLVLAGKTRSDMFAALMSWVEGKSSPASIWATTWKNGVYDYLGNPVAYRQRPLCPYPQRAELIYPYLPPDLVTSWRCSQD